MSHRLPPAALRHLAPSCASQRVPPACLARSVRRGDGVIAEKRITRTIAKTSRKSCRRPDSLRPSASTLNQHDDCGVLFGRWEDLFWAEANECKVMATTFTFTSSSEATSLPGAAITIET
jgi:hypothetical protein